MKTLVTLRTHLQKHCTSMLPINLSVRGNNKPHVTKNLRKAMMKRTRLKTIANRTGSDRDIRNYKSQRNLVVKMNRQAKKEFYANLDPTEIGNSKKFWKTFKPIFTKGTVNTNEKSVLVEDGHILDDDETIGECFISCFVNITHTLDLPKATVSVHEDVTHEDPVLQAINKYQHHLSIQMIKQNVGHLAEENKFEFSHINPTSVWNEINQLKGELTRKNELGSFCSEFACDFKSEIIFLICALIFPLFTRLCVNDVIPTPREISEVKTKLSACVIKMSG